MKRLWVVLVVAVLSLTAVAPALAAPTSGCEHEMAATVESLHHCVKHAADAGFIDSAGVAKSLLAKVEAAQRAVDRGQTAVAVAKLRAFVHEVEAQAGKHINLEHAQHMAQHAQMVIEALGG